MFRKFGFTALKLAVVAGFAAPVLLFGPACAPECLDRMDCLSKAKHVITNLPDGGTSDTLEEYTCDKGKCVLGSPVCAPKNDAGGC